ncbi:uncharacterized protein V6R79_023183 [Siganus canaliculatus]
MFPEEVGTVCCLSPSVCRRQRPRYDTKGRARGSEIEESKDDMKKDELDQVQGAARKTPRESERHE